jgi:DNA-binding transcriptional ArsR family regulator
LNRKEPKCRRDPRINELAEGLKTLSDPNRLKIICFLRGSEACVNDIERELGISQQLTSHHLRVLLNANFLTMRKDGTRSLYSVDRDRLTGIYETFVEYMNPCKESC